MSDRIKISVKDHIADVQLARPEKMNALDESMFLGIIETAKQIKQDASIRVVVLSGLGKAFCAGLDLSNFSPDGVGGGGNDIITRTYGIANKWQQAAWAWRDLPVPVIAAVHGVSFGGGLQIMLGADIKYIKADTKLAIMEMKWGIIPDMAGTQLMRHSVRDDIIRELTYTNRIFSGKQAVEYGFATHVSDDPYNDAHRLAAEIALKNPDAIVNAKKLLNESPYLSAEDGLMLESKLQEEVIGKKNQFEAVFSSMQKRAPKFDDYR